MNTTQAESVPRSDLTPEQLKVVLGTERKRISEILARRGLSLADFQAPSVWHCVRYLLTIWLGGFAVIALWMTDSIPLMVLAIVGMGIVQTAAVLVVHEASHRLLLPDRRANELVGNLFFALPVGLTVESYRSTHQLHHNFLNTDRDPSGFITRAGLSRARVFQQLLFLSCGRVLFDLAVRTVSGKRLEKTVVTPGRDEKVANAERQRAIYVLMYHLPIIVVALYFNIWDIWLVWVLSTVLLVPFLDGIRTLIEHRPGPDAPENFHTRSHHRWLIVSGLVTPYFQYHWEHHVFPSVPHFQLARLHALLVEEQIAAAIPVKGGPFGGLMQAMAKEKVL